jgi:sec-independent protein translocase protein TatC
MRQNQRKTRLKQKTTKRSNRVSAIQPNEIPFLGHIHELRARASWIVLSIVLFAAVGYMIQDALIAWLLKPAADQQFIYTTPGGGMNFIIQISIYFGIAVSIPLVVYHFFRYIEPLLKRRDNAFIIKCTLFSAVLAISGIAFGYYVGLPAAMHFLGKQLDGEQNISALLTLSDYLSFVTIYLAGAAVMFQLPVIVVFMNRVKTLSPKKLLKGERWVIIGAFITAAIITPTPDLINQAIVAVPIILVYQIGVFLVWFQNRYSKHHRVQRLLQEDERRQSERESVEHLQLYTPRPPEPVAQPDIPVPAVQRHATLDPIRRPSPAQATPAMTANLYNSSGSQLEGSRPLVGG